MDLKIGGINSSIQGNFNIDLSMHVTVLDQANQINGLLNFQGSLIIPRV